MGAVADRGGPAPTNSSTWTASYVSSSTVSTMSQGAQLGAPGPTSCNGQAPFGVHCANVTVAAQGCSDDARWRARGARAASATSSPTWRNSQATVSARMSPGPKSCAICPARQGPPT
eukprot:9486432-Pyramimonas_sp.AAC.1